MSKDAEKHELKQTSESSKAKIKSKIITIANQLLKVCKSDPNQSKHWIPIPDEISSIRQLKSDIFVFFYENICSTELIDKKWPCKNQEEEIHNLQSVIDSLSLDVLHEDLSHLTAESILGLSSTKKRDLLSLEYLLDILKTTHEWITSRVENTEAIESTTVQSEKFEDSKNEYVPHLDKKYSEFDRKIEETVKMTQEAIKNAPNEKEDDSFFQEYMRQKELEFKLKNCQNLANEIETLKSSSGNSSFNDSSCESFNLLNIAADLNSNQKHVKFKTDSRTRSNSPQIRLSKTSNVHRPSRRKIAQCKNALIHSLGNEIGLIKTSLADNLEFESDKIEHLMSLIYFEDYQDAQAMMQHSLNKVKKKSNLTNDLYMNAHDGRKNFKSNLTPSESSRSKGVLLPRSRSLVKFGKKRSSSMTNLNCSQIRQKRWNSAVKKSMAQSKDPSKQFYSRFIIGEDGILNCLLEEFPHLYTSPETIHYLWSRHARQIEILGKEQKELETKYLSKDSGTNLADQYLKEANRKQEVLMEIMRKELDHIERQQDMKRKQLVENSLKAKTREQRFQSAKVKRYFEEFRTQQRAKMLKQKTSEELIFKKLFNESLKIQKERMLELKKYAKEKNDINRRQQINQIKSIENFYKNKFDLLNEQMKREKDENQLRDGAQHLVLSKMKSQVKNKLEDDIRDLQDQMYRDKDFLYWRQLDADRLKQDIQKASYFRPMSK
ncbi:centrosomal of 95 kDa-like [Brachionus plicatilis]|uniref:Centrosomal of 95 kDa-like n=1 Tax=Brachionus plicatilis TaxID=10195 RepID=A0A3M7TAQ1_BRAPC|nr:centrosomal of 95 kDa-like [Brachionus plicatilis]